MKTTQDMGNGMSSFVPTPSSTTLSTYNLYTHYVAGLVGIGLSQLFSASGLESPKLALQTDLANTMGCFLQKVNILKDFGVDCNEGRVWWPKEVWSKWIPNTPSTSPNHSSSSNNSSDATIHSTPNGSDVEMIGGVKQLMEPHNRERAIGCLNELCADGLSGWTGCLEWMSQVNNASVFRFAAVPQVSHTQNIFFLPFYLHNFFYFHFVNIDKRKKNFVFTHFPIFFSLIPFFFCHYYLMGIAHGY